jgi:hypothetical protein
MWLHFHTDLTQDTLAAVYKELRYLSIDQPWLPQYAGVCPNVTEAGGKRAKLLLHVIRRKGHAFLSPKWRARLELAGVSPDTLEIVDARRWAWAWTQLKVYRFRSAIQLQNLALGDAWPAQVPGQDASMVPVKPLKTKRPVT